MLDVAKTISPCVLWIDEIEKGLSELKVVVEQMAEQAQEFLVLFNLMQEKKRTGFCCSYC